ncbi:amino acid adenylation domain-containing protein, partial [Candidatus Amarobacter glycogenicus]|uniref:amino acid adenylation domain-containing protein n=1 Tax=Candidatus Amarobacter glycogenicus TaxID=3140699 RepID=UPI002A172574|nr:amino acid adenylation domain-containing protein [Dehalococcoidia bacterium]
SSVAGDLPEGVLLHELFLAQVARTPEAVALIWPGDEVPSTTDATSSDPPATLTYRDLQASAQRLAHALSANGVRQGDLVGLCTPRSPSMVAGVLGILLAGAAYVPLDPSYPSARLAYLLDDARPRVLLAHRAAASQLPPLPSGTSLLWLDDLLASSPLDTLSPLEDSPPFALPSDPERDQRIAYVIYTSGSTGLPKGVAISHRSVVHLACSLDAAVYRPAGLALLMPADEDGPDGMPPWRALRASLNAPLAFDASVQQLLLILGGHALVLVPESARRDPAALVELVRSEHLDVLDCTPSHLQALLSAGLLDIDRTAPRPPPALLLIGGEDLHKALWTTLAEAAEGADRTLSMNVYGPTECTVDATVGLVTAELPSIGRPLPGVEAYVLDRQLRPCPIGVPGELYIGGAGLAHGYLRRPALTAERFVPHPFSTLPGARLYKTGDRARWLPDGNLEYLGRLDHQVKIRGHRVELGEVEATLRRLQGVGDAAVIAIAGRALPPKTPPLPLTSASSLMSPPPILAPSPPMRRSRPTPSAQAWPITCLPISSPPPSSSSTPSHSPPTANSTAMPSLLPTGACWPPPPPARATPLVPPWRRSSPVSGRGY